MAGEINWLIWFPVKRASLSVKTSKICLSKVILKHILLSTVASPHIVAVERKRYNQQLSFCGFLHCKKCPPYTKKFSFSPYIVFPTSKKIIFSFYFSAISIVFFFFEEVCVWTGHRKLRDFKIFYKHHGSTNTSLFVYHMLYLTPCSYQS